MELIKLFFLGALGYLLSGFYDMAKMHLWSPLKHILFIGYPLTALPYGVLLRIQTSPHAPAVQLVLGVCFAVFIILLIYSVFLEPLKGRAGHTYRSGTYSFSRHPGFIWYTCINIIAVIYFWDALTALLCFGLVGCNLMLIGIEDRYLFPRIFPDYPAYKQTTAFLISCPKHRIVKKR
ncbi:MAG: isoprenylcysteine carboxylmethyltransferase family protein [Spirochaetota bacterium]